MVLPTTAVTKNRSWIQTRGAGLFRACYRAAIGIVKFLLKPVQTQPLLRNGAYDKSKLQPMEVAAFPH